MTIFSLINIGLITDIIGALIIYKFGLPSAATRSIHALSFQDPTHKEIIEIKITRFMSPVGVILLIVGFTLQLLGNILC